MDLTTLVVPGAQSLVSAVLTDSWDRVRTALARHWARRQPRDGVSGPDAACVEQATVELDLARQQALVLAGTGSENERARRMELFWAGYLAGQLAARPELGEAVHALPSLVAAAASFSQTTVSERKTVSGTVHGNVVQADDVSGGIRFG